LNEGQTDVEKKARRLGGLLVSSNLRLHGSGVQRSGRNGGFGKNIKPIKNDSRVSKKLGGKRSSKRLTTYASECARDRGNWMHEEKRVME